MKGLDPRNSDPIVRESYLHAEASWRRIPLASADRNFVHRLQKVCIEGERMNDGIWRYNIGIRIYGEEQVSIWHFGLTDKRKKLTYKYFPHGFTLGAL